MGSRVRALGSEELGVSEVRVDRWKSRGISYLELMVALAVLMVLASAVIPVARWDQKRRMEEHLRIDLQTMRDAIDQYKRYADLGLIQQTDVEQMGYPLTLDALTEEVEIGDPTSPESKKIKFLQRLPIDPFTGDTDWGKRSYQDDWDSDQWGGENVYDVYSQSPGRALDGTYYRDW